MEKLKKHIVLIIIGGICIVLVILLIKNNYNKPVKINEININNSVLLLTNNKDDYLEYKEIEGFDVYNNNRDFEIQIQNPSIITYRNIKVGDSINKLDFCKRIGTVYYFETDYRYNGYYMEIIYGKNPFDDTILSITYRFFYE